MTDELAAARLYAESTYNAAADVYDAEPLAFWHRTGQQSLSSAEDFWTVAMGSGLRWTIDQLGEEAALEVRQEVLARLADAGVDRIATNVIYAAANRSPGAR